MTNASLWSRTVCGQNEWVPDPSHCRSRSGSRVGVSAASIRSSHTASLTIGSVVPASSDIRNPFGNEAVIMSNMVIK